MGAEASDSQIEQDVRDLIAGLERELAAANRHRLALERHRVPEWFDRAERQLLRTLRRVAMFAALILLAGTILLWTVDPIWGMASIPLAPILLLALVLGCENALRRVGYPRRQLPR